jgi:hypothetical protein
MYILHTLEYGIALNMVGLQYTKKIQLLVNSFIRRILGLTRSSKVYKIAWLTGIELRNDAYARTLRRLNDIIEEDRCITYEVIKEQENVVTKKKSRLIKLLEENKRKTVKSKKEHLKSYLDGIEYQNTLIKKMSMIRDGKFVIKYLVGDLYKFKDGIFVPFKIRNLSVENFIKKVKEGDLCVGRYIKYKYLNDSTELELKNACRVHMGQ